MIAPLGETRTCLVEDLPLGVVDVVLHLRLGDLVERRARDRVPVELVGHELLKFLGNGLALPESISRA